MALRSGLGAQLGMKAEMTYGTPVTVDRFYEFESESLNVDVGKVYNFAIGTGRWQRADRVKTYIRTASGSIVLPVMTKGFGLLFEHAIGSNTITGDGDDKTHTIVPDANGGAGKSLTVQVGRPDVSGTVRPFTYEGGKVTSYELACNLDELLKLTLNLDFENVLTSTALASASVPSGNEMFIFTEGSLTIGGNTAFVRTVTISGDNGLNVERRGLSNVKREPVAAGEATITGNLECEFESLDAYTAWSTGTTAALVLTFESPTAIAETETPYSLTVTLPAIEYTGSTPQVGGPDIVMQPLPFKALANGSDPIIKVEYVTSDTAS